MQPFPDGSGLKVQYNYFKQMEHYNPNGIFILSEETMPQLARQVADLLRKELCLPKTRQASLDNPLGDEELITKAKACEILDRCDSTLSKWAKRGILVPVRRGGSLYYRLKEVMKVYNGEL